MAGEISKIAIIGAGLLGRSRAMVFARAECPVALYDGRAGTSASALDLNAPGGIADYARRLGPLDQSIAASTVTHEVWDEGLIAKVEAGRRRLPPEHQPEARMAWRDRQVMALGRHKRNMQDAPS